MTPGFKPFTMKITAAKWGLVVKAIAKIKCKNKTLSYMCGSSFLTVPPRITYDLRCY